MKTILIKNILLLDGTKAPPKKTDVLVRNDKIAAIGNFPRYKADDIIDGLGTAYLTPGFIDVNTYSDLYLNLFSNALQEDFLLQGVTTIIGGQSGISLAPLFQGSLDLHKFWSNPNQINMDWHTVDEFLGVMSKRKLGVNFGTLVGHSTIRHAISGDDFRDLTQKELDVMRLILERALKNGAFGISFDLNFPLTALTPYKELKMLLEVVEKYKRLATFKIRNGSDTTVIPKDEKEKFVSSINELINLGKETGARIQINNLACLKGFEKVYSEALDLISENSAMADVAFNIHPFDVSLIPIFSFLPLWAQRGSLKEIRQNLANPELVKNIKKELPLLKLEDIKIYQAPGFEYLIGKSLKEFNESRELNFRDGLLELMRLTKMQAVLAVKNISLKSLDRALVHERSSISSSGSSFHGDHPSDKMFDFHKAFPTFLKIISERHLMPIESAIKRITRIPSLKLGLSKRGLIKENYFADLVVLRDFKVDTVVVGGKIAVREGKVTNFLNGKILRSDYV